MTFDRHPYRRLTPGSTAHKRVLRLRRAGMTLLAAAVLAAWAAALPALLGKDGLSWQVNSWRVNSLHMTSWRTDDCGAPGYRDPVTGQVVIRATACRPLPTGHAP